MQICLRVCDHARLFVRADMYDANTRLRVHRLSEVWVLLCNCVWEECVGRECVQCGMRVEWSCTRMRESVRKDIVAVALWKTISS